MHWLGSGSVGSATFWIPESESRSGSKDNISTKNCPQNSNMNRWKREINKNVLIYEWCIKLLKISKHGNKIIRNSSVQKFKILKKVCDLDPGGSDPFFPQSESRIRIRILIKIYWILIGEGGGILKYLPINRTKLVEGRMKGVEWNE